MLGFGKNMGILLLTITVILSATAFLTTQNIAEPSPNDSSFVLGHVTLKVLDENGYVKDYRQSDNVIVADGWNALVQTAFPGDYSFGAIPATSGAFTHVGLGSGAGPLGGGNVSLGTALVACPRVAFADIFSDGAQVDLTLFSTIDIEIAADFAGATCTDNVVINEAGIFNDATTGEMFARNTFGDVPALGISDALELDWTLTFTGLPPE